MKSMMKKTLAALIILSLVLAMASCGGGGGNDPKSLAKQNAELTLEGIKLMSEGATITDPKLEAVAKKQTDVLAKVEKLSEADKAIYQEELERILTAAP